MKHHNRILRLSAANQARRPMRFRYGSGNSAFVDVAELFTPPKTLGAASPTVAQDAALNPINSLSSSGLPLGLCGCANAGFIGYPALALLAQDGLIRAGVETVADDMTKKWIELSRKGDTKDANNDGEDDSIARLKEAMEKFRLQPLFNEAAQMCGYFGGCLAYIDMGPAGDDLKNPLTAQSFNPERFRGFKLIEPVNVSPGSYETIDPLSPGYYRPETWRMQGREIHRSRFLYFVDNEPPLMLKPAYNFFGIPQAQIALDYVADFTQSRGEAVRLLQKFSTLFVKTNMNDVLTGGPTEDLDRRMQFMADNRSNSGITAIDKEEEDIAELATPLAGVTDIVRQSIEFVAAIFRIPAVKFLGITPGGLNATGEADITNYYDYIASQQEKQLRRPLSRALELLQAVAFGKPDPAISFTFVPLAEEDQTAKMQRLLSFAQSAQVLSTGTNALSQQEIRAALNNSPDNIFGKLDVNTLPPVQQYEEEGLTGIPDAELSTYGGAS